MKKEFIELRDQIVEVILEGMDQGFQRLNARMDNFEERLVPVERDIASIKGTIDEMQGDLAAALRATDQHALELMDHGKRIGRLEKRFA